MTTIVIIGAGFSGTVTAIEYLRRAQCGDVLIMINRSGKMARGLAYGTNSPHHLLNVPAGNMTALVDQPDSFLAYCKDHGHEGVGSSFMPRQIYGEYLEHLLETAVVDSAAACLRLVGDVTAIRHLESGSEVAIAGQPSVRADHVVLAFGNFPPAQPAGVEAIVDSDAYSRDPWGPLPAIQSGQAPDVLLIGSGLTAVDALIEIRQHYPQATFTLLSRRGLLPTGHRDRLPTPGYSGDIARKVLQAPVTLRRLVRTMREEIALAPDLWRDIVAAIRPVTPALWQALDTHERGRFLRHLQPYWDVHRHRLAPASHRLLERTLEDITVQVVAGRVLSLNSKANGVKAVIKRRRSRTQIEMSFDWVINCTGPSTRIRHLHSPLIQQLLADGMLSVDPLELGLLTAPDGAVIDQSGVELAWLSYVGPMLRATWWEATAVPELRRHAQELAIRLAGLYS